ncbi:ubiquitin-like domain-containing protein [Paenibacillus urinalis]|uniref:Ubiquitin-like domain-containing protein n=1 Tax=Paenibacillus urinalis TaxID=521520 RepID=A0AAX3N0P5_9BACL|nr:3D domain-containing protein [Paenibacillus urinalis]WDH82734.1 ubiquitin-like domain-containing protein [Paenibacillus urinalis]WDH98783.1 ubiquitin-like domain-containing protein [Paenibacillus urinalis]WDI02478.1 ubiquitin-like domain-containing protein [Paenibacillus urinalis]
MGNFQLEETHESPSSSKSFALRWKHENLRQITLVAIFSIALLVMISLILYGQGGKEISIVVDGKVQALETREGMLSEVLDEHSIAVSPHDEVSMSLSDEIEDGDRVTINRAVAINVTADGETEQVYTTQDTVKEALAAHSIEVLEDDKVYPAADTAVKADLNIRVVRVTKQTATQEASVPFKVIKTADPSLYKGDNRVIQSGKEGVIVQTIEKTFQDGELVSKKMTGKKVQTNRVDKVIAVGTKKKPEPVQETVVAAVSTTEAAATSKASNASSSKSSANLADKVKKVSASTDSDSVTKDGVTFKAKKVLSNVSMTAYSSEQEGIGTKTASGTRVQEGRTIAVDPDVIPLGWWVYIEGVGFRRAEDTGGAIKGNKIDVYYDSLEQALNFGRKKGKTVYVIGPVKPELN